MTLLTGLTPDTLAAARTGGFPFALAGLPATATARLRLAKITDLARSQLAEPWPALRASVFLRYRRDGDRGAFEGPYFARRNRLGAAALAWAATREAAFADALADGLWLVCEESTWCLPAHFAHGAPEGTGGLPNAGWSGSIDLFACETACCLAEACQFAGEALDAVDPAIRPRVRAEIRRRTIQPLLDGLQLHWQAGTSNWGPWCASSLIIAAGWVLDDDAALWGRFVHAMLGTVDRYYQRQGADGGCDEGVTYWNVAGGAVIRAIEEVRARAPGVLEPWADGKLGRIARYPACMHLGDRQFPAFGDTVPRAHLWSGILARAATLSGAADLAALAQAMSGHELGEGRIQKATGDLLQSQLRALWWQDALPEPAARPLQDTWLPDLHVLVAHGGGLSLAAKGGHNAENHNHNDVGQVVVHYRGRPVLVDVGRGEYTAQTFSSRRYDLWWPRGSGHAVPIVDGLEQATGWEHRAKDVSAGLEPDRAWMELDLSACYAHPDLSVRRRVTLDRTAPAVEIRDRLAGCTSYRLPLRFACEAVADGNGWLVGGLRLTAPGLTGRVERIDLTGERVLASSWPDGLWLLTLERTVADRCETVVRLCLA